jgi:hypothetical protein
MDIAVGNFNGFDGSFAMNYITKNPNRAPAQWTQIAGLPQGTAQQNPVSPQACGAQPKEEGTPTPAQTIPPLSGTPSNPLQQQIPPTQQPAQSYQTSAYPAQPTPSGSSGVSTGGTIGQIPEATQVNAQPNLYPQPIPTQNGVVLTTTPVVPAQQTSGSISLSTGTTGILPSLFQQTSATSDLRILQNAAQTVTDLFMVPPIQTDPLLLGVLQTQSTQSGGTAPQPTIVYDDSNISLMALSQSADMDVGESVAPTTPLSETPRPNNPVLAAMSQQPSTFNAHSFTEQASTTTSSVTAVLRTILDALRVVLVGIIKMFSY